MKTQNISNWLVVLFSTLAVSVAGIAWAQVKKTYPPAASSEASKPATPLDPKLKAAEEARTTVLKRGVELEKSTNDLLRVIQEMDHTLTTQTIAWEQLKDHMALLTKAGNDVKSSRAQFNKDFLLYKTALEKAPPAFQELVTMYMKYAQEEDDDFFKEQYLDMADASKNFGEVTKKRLETINAINAEVTKKLGFVDKSLLWLERFNQFAMLYDPVLDKGGEVERILNELNQYIAYFEKSMKAFKDFSKKVLDTTGDSPSSSEDQKERSKPVLGPQARRAPSQSVATETAINRPQSRN